MDRAAAMAGSSALSCPEHDRSENTTENIRPVNKTVSVTISHFRSTTIPAMTPIAITNRLLTILDATGYLL